MPMVYNKKSKNAPADAVYVGRPSKWGNPFVIGQEYSRAEAIQKYREYLSSSYLCHEIHELKGKDLVCWCAPEPCHADVLLELANAD